MKRKIISFILIALFLFMLTTSANAETIKSPKDVYVKISEYLKNSVDNAHVPGMSVIIVDKDNVLFSDTYGNCKSIDTPFIIGSMSKSFTALSIMQLHEQGKIDLDKTAVTYIPGRANLGQITVRQLLNQTSGLGKYQRLSNINITNASRTHQYANINYNLLGEIIEAVSDMSYEKYVTEHIFKPLGMHKSAASLGKSKETGLIAGYRNYFGFSVAGEPNYPDKNSWGLVSAGYISSSVSDMGKYLQMYLNGGDPVISQAGINTMFYDNVYVKASNPYYYGMGWILSEHYNEPVLKHDGLVENYKSNMFILPESGLGVVMLANTNDFLVSDDMMGSIAESIILMLMGKEPIEISTTSYWGSHLLLDAGYLIIFTCSIIPLLFLKRYKKKCPALKPGKAAVSIGILHIVLPVGILLIPWASGTPLWVVYSYVPDLFIVLTVSAALLFIGGAIKVIMFLKHRCDSECGGDVPLVSESRQAVRLDGV